MITTAIFDGEVLRPEKPLELEANCRYTITLNKVETETGQKKTGSWKAIAALAGTVEMPPDWSLEHDHYLYGTPKRYSQEDA